MGCRQWCVISAEMGLGRWLCILIRSSPRGIVCKKNCLDRHCVDVGDFGVSVLRSWHTMHNILRSLLASYRRGWYSTDQRIVVSRSIHRFRYVLITISRERPISDIDISKNQVVKILSLLKSDKSTDYCTMSLIILCLKIQCMGGLYS